VGPRAGPDVQGKSRPQDGIQSKRTNMLRPPPMCRSVCQGFIDVTGQLVARRPESAYRKQITSDWHVEPKGLIIVASCLGVPRQGRPETCGCTGQVNNMVSPKTDVGRDSSVGIATRCGLDGPGIESR
jgi:hypothetical protein